MGRHDSAVGEPWADTVKGGVSRGRNREQSRAASPVTIAADELVGDENAKSAEFIGNVKVIRGEYTLLTDRLKVLFDAVEKPAAGKSHPRTNIREIVAEGHVHVCSTNYSQIKTGRYTTAKPERWF